MDARWEGGGKAASHQYEVTLSGGGDTSTLQSHLESTRGGSGKAALHGCEVTLWQMRCYLFNVQSPNKEHLEKLPLI